MCCWTRATKRCATAAASWTVPCCWRFSVRDDGKRELLGVSVKLSEAEVHWREFLTSLKDRGLCGMTLFVSDDHAG